MRAETRARDSQGDLGQGKSFAAVTSYQARAVRCLLITGTQINSCFGTNLLARRQVRDFREGGELLQTCVCKRIVGCLILRECVNVELTKVPIYFTLVNCSASTRPVPETLFGCFRAKEGKNLLRRTSSLFSSLSFFSRQRDSRVSDIPHRTLIARAYVGNGSRILRDKSRPYGVEGERVRGRRECALTIPDLPTGPR